MRHLYFSLVLAACANGGNGTGDGGGNNHHGDGGGSNGSGGGGGDGGGGVCASGLGPWTGNDNVAPSASPPCALTPAQVPQLVAIGFDDNAYSGLPGTNGTGGMTWATDMVRSRKNADSSPIHLSFYMTSVYADEWSSESQTYVKRAWRTALVDGHEIGNHTRSHSHGSAFSLTQWKAEMQSCIDRLKQAVRSERGDAHARQHEGHRRDGERHRRLPHAIPRVQRRDAAGRRRISASGTTAASRTATSTTRTARNYLLAVHPRQRQPGSRGAGRVGQQAADLAAPGTVGAAGAPGDRAARRQVRDVRRPARPARAAARRGRAGSTSTAGRSPASTTTCGSASR